MNLLVLGLVIGIAIGWILAILKQVLCGDLDNTEASHWRRQYNRLYEQMEFENNLKKEVR